MTSRPTRDACTAAYFHHPRFASSGVGNNTAVAPFWQALYDAGAEVVLNGHAHNYERFAPQTPGGQANSQRGIREFVVGTGGKSLNAFETPYRANSEVRLNNANGVIKLTLHPNSYDWEFVTAPGGKPSPTPAAAAATVGLPLHPRDRPRSRTPCPHPARRGSPPRPTSRPPSPRP